MYVALLIPPDIGPKWAGGSRSELDGPTNGTVRSDYEASRSAFYHGGPVDGVPPSARSVPRRTVPTGSGWPGIGRPAGMETVGTA